MNNRIDNETLKRIVDEGDLWWIDPGIQKMAAELLQLRAEREGIPQVEVKVRKWAQDRGLDDPELVKSQFVKLVEEVGELASDIARGRDPRDSIGDTLVVLTILAQQLDTDLSECLTVAYDQIKNRTGKMVNGVFVKDGDGG